MTETSAPFLGQNERSHSNNQADPPETSQSVLDENEPIPSVLTASDLRALNEFFNYIDHSHPLFRSSAGPAALSSGRLARPLIRIPLCDLRRRVSEGDKKSLSEGKPIASNADESSKNSSPDADCGVKRNVNGQPTVLTKALPNANSETTEHIATPGPPANRHYHKPAEGTNRAYSLQDENRQAALTWNAMPRSTKEHPDNCSDEDLSCPVGIAHPCSQSAENLSSIFGEKMRLFAGEADNEKQDGTVLRVRRDSSSSNDSIPSGKFRSDIAISLESYCPVVTTPGSPDSEERNDSTNNQSQRLKKECSESPSADDESHMLKPRTITDDSPSANSHATGPNSSNEPSSLLSRLADHSSKKINFFSKLNTAHALKLVHPRSELRPETVVRLLEATVKNIICAEVVKNFTDRTKLDSTIQSWHELGTGMRLEQV